MPSFIVKGGLYSDSLTSLPLFGRVETSEAHGFIHAVAKADVCLLICKTTDLSQKF